MLSYKEYLEEAQETKIYKNNKGQFVSLTKHVEMDREHRKWWDSYEDESFLKMIKPTLNHLNKSERKDLRYRDEWAILTKDKTKGFIISLRYNQSTDKNDSFAIITILNSKAKDSASKDEIFVNVDANKKFVLNESKQVEILLYI